MTIKNNLLWISVKLVIIIIKRKISIIYIFFISIIHLRCIREVFSDALSLLPISGYFSIISAPTVTPAWLWKSQAASMISMCYARASTKAKKKIIIRPDFSRSYRHLSFSKQPMKTRHSTLLCYIIPSLPHLVSPSYFRNRYQSKMLF